MTSRGKFQLGMGLTRSGCDIGWGRNAAFYLDGGIGTSENDDTVPWIFGITDSSADGESEDVHHSYIYGDAITDLLVKNCKHTLTIRGEVHGGSICAVNDRFDETWSNAITVWINKGPGECDGPPICSTARVGRPVDIVTGEMFHQMLDLRIDGPLPIEFMRRFRSGSTATGALGYGWQHDGMIRLENSEDGHSQVFIGKDMRRVTFSCAQYKPGHQDECNGTWEPDTIDHLALTEASDSTWMVTDKHKLTYHFDSSKRLTSIQDRNGNLLTYGYNPSTGDLETITDSFGRSMALGDYSGSPRLLHTVSAGTRSVAYSYDENQNLTLVEYSDGSYVQYAYGDQYEEPPRHNLTAATDALGNLIESHTYMDDPSSPVGFTKSQDDNYAYTINYYDQTHRKVKNGRDPQVETVFTIDPHKGVALDRIGGPGCSSCGDAGDETHKIYDNNLNVTDNTDGRGVRTHMTYDSMGNILTRTEAYATAACERGTECDPEACADGCVPLLERTTTYTYDDTYNFPTTITVPTVGTGSCLSHYPDKVVTLEYDNNGNLKSQTTEGCNGDEAFTSETGYDYDSSENYFRLLTVTDPRNHTTHYAYYENDDNDMNRRGRLYKVTDALGHETRYDSYDLFGNVLSVTDPNDVTTAYLYNFRDQVTEKRIKLAGEASNNNIVTEYKYDDVGNLTKIRLPKCCAQGNGCEYSFAYEYDGVNRLKEVHDSLGNKIIYSYDAEGNRIREEYKDASAAVTKFTNFKFDDFNRPLYVQYNETPDPPDNDSTYFGYTYYGDGTRHTERDPEGHTTTFTYDDLKRLKTVSQTVGSETLTTSYEYDSQDNLIAITDPLYPTTYYLSGDLGWRVSESSQDRGHTLYTYDLAGNLVTSEDENGITVTRTYDELNRLAATTYPHESLNVTNSYDSDEVDFGIGRRTGLTDSSGSTKFGYDRRGLLTSEQKTMRDVTYVTTYGYDKNGNLTEILYPSSAAGVRQGIVAYDYDDADRVYAVSTRVNNASTAVAGSFQYKPFGPRSQMTFVSELLDLEQA